MFTKLLPIAILLGAAAQASGQSLQRPGVPDKIEAPANEEVVLMAHGSGAQIYVCKAGPTETRLGLEGAGSRAARLARRRHRHALRRANLEI